MSSDIQFYKCSNTGRLSVLSYNIIPLRQCTNVLFHTYLVSVLVSYALKLNHAVLRIILLLDTPNIFYHCLLFGQYIGYLTAILQ